MAASAPAPVRCLLIYPRFSELSCWNFVEAARVAGKKYNTAPLGLMTVAALLPPHWDCRLADLNAAPLDETALDWADVVLTGGMITQQRELLRLIRLARSRGKPVVVGGPDPTSQPHVYREADFLVLDEGELTVPKFLAAWESGARSGVFRADGARPDVQLAPIPRFDLIRFSDYLYIGVQFSRGCPYNCEFCDIIELYGRVPRHKPPEQALAELDVLYRSGWRGHVDFVDDNFIGDKKAVKEFLRRLRDWSKERGWPFFFSTEATITLAADEELLGLMRDCDFRFVFVGIETPDPELLRRAQKRQNLLAPIAQSVRRINEAGITVLAGFILGFDGETPGAGEAVAACVEEIRTATVLFGLLTSLPNTQLDRRLRAEGRLLERAGGTVTQDSEIDQTTGGLNFRTRRPRAEILAEYRGALGKIYAPGAYFARIRRFLAWYKPRLRHKPALAKLPRFAWTFLKLNLEFLKRPRLLPQYLWTLAVALPRGGAAFGMAATLATFYLHMEAHSGHVAAHVASQLGELEADGEEAYLRGRSFIAAPAVRR